MTDPEARKHAAVRLAKPTPTRGAKAREAEIAAASAAIADAGPRRGPSRRQIEGTIRSLEANAARAERDGYPQTAARRRDLAEAQRALLAEA